MKDFELIHPQLINDIRNILLTNGFSSAKDFMTDNGLPHKKAHEEILDLIVRNIATQLDKMSLQEINDKAMNDLIGKTIQFDMYKEIKKAESSDNAIQILDVYHICSLVKTYLTSFYSHYYKIANSQLQYTQKEIFTFPHLQPKTEEQLKENYNYLKNKMGGIATNPHQIICMLMQADGTCYFAPTSDHQTLAMWLNLNDISIKNGLRLEACRNTLDFDFSTLFNYRMSLESNKDKNVELTDIQAQNISTLYQTLQYAWTGLKPFGTYLKFCSGMGLTVHDYDPQLSRINCIKFANYLGDQFNDYEYLKDLRSQKKDPNVAETRYLPLTQIHSDDEFIKE